MRRLSLCAAGLSLALVLLVAVAPFLALFVAVSAEEFVECQL